MQQLALILGLGASVPTAKQIRELLNLRALPVEGGYFAETYRSKCALTEQSLPTGYRGERALSAAIYYMLTPDTFSAIHRLKGDGGISCQHDHDFGRSA
jgi:uncharacterized protein